MNQLTLNSRGGKRKICRILSKKNLCICHARFADGIGFRGFRDINQASFNYGDLVIHI